MIVKTYQSVKNFAPLLRAGFCKVLFCLKFNALSRLKPR